MAICCRMKYSDPEIVRVKLIDASMRLQHIIGSKSLHFEELMVCIQIRQLHCRVKFGKTIDQRVALLPSNAMVIGALVVSH